VVIASALGPDAAIFSHRRRPPRTRQAAACGTRRVVFGSAFGKVAV
jgi:hypothetical protein